MGARSYVPQLGRFLQTDPIPGGSANAYAYVFGDPVDESDPSGKFAAWFREFTAKNSIEVVEAAAAREKAAEEEAARRAMEAEEAENKAKEATELSAALGAGGPEGPLGGSSGWAEEYAAETGQEEEGSYSGGGGRFVNNEDPDDHTPRVESECNRTGQHCPGHRGGGHGGGGGAVTCSDVGSAVGGFVGGVIGTAVGPEGTSGAGYIGAGIGGYLGSKIC